MTKIISFIICLILCGGLIAGCGGPAPGGSGNDEAARLKNEISGTWNQITEDGTPSLPEMGIPSGYVFYQDGTGLDTFWDMPFHYTIGSEKLHIAYDDSLGEDWDYEYSIEGDVLTLTRVDDDALTMLYQREPEEEPETVEE